METAIFTASSQPRSTSAEVTTSDSASRRASATCLIEEVALAIAARSSSVKAGEMVSTGEATLSTSAASFSATRGAGSAELRSVTASARRTSSAASSAIMRRMSRGGGAFVLVHALIDAAAELVGGGGALVLGLAADQSADVRLGQCGTGRSGHRVPPGIRARVTMRDRP